jgi:hypothetical protein
VSNDPLHNTVTRLFPTLSANPEMADVLVRCERWLQNYIASRPAAEPDRDSAVTRTLAPVSSK